MKNELVMNVGSPELSKAAKPNRNKKLFRQVKDASMVSIECPSCKNEFGITMTFINIVGEAIFEYACPYCRSVHFLAQKD